MQDLTVVGRSTDGTRLILRSATGVEFSVPIDDPLVAAISAAHGPPSGGAPARLEAHMEGPLRPRDIQSRIRAGESPDALAEAAGADVERIMVFARPVLAERAHIAERAQRASLRRRHGDGTTRLLGDVVAEHLRAENISPDSVAWDSWRREDGRWALTAAWPESETAEFLFDAAGRYVVAENDAARWLVMDLPESRPAGAPLAPPVSEPIRVATTDPELPFGEDAIGLVNDSRIAADGVDDWMATQASEPTGPIEHATRVSDHAETAEDAPDDASDDAGDTEETEEQPAQRKTRRHRASVPSWDEIMFGSGPHE